MFMIVKYVMKDLKGQKIIKVVLQMSQKNKTVLNYTTILEQFVPTLRYLISMILLNSIWVINLFVLWFIIKEEPVATIVNNKIKFVMLVKTTQEVVVNQILVMIDKLLETMDAINFGIIKFVFVELKKVNLKNQNKTNKLQNNYVNLLDNNTLLLQEPKNSSEMQKWIWKMMQKDLLPIG